MAYLEIARIRPEGMAKIRKQAFTECKDNWVYKKAKTEEVRQRIVEGKVTELLLARYLESEEHTAKS